MSSLYGELQPLVTTDELLPIDDFAGKLARRGVPDARLALGKFGTKHPSTSHGCRQAKEPLQKASSIIMI
jgi:hypothetical protein